MEEEEKMLLFHELYQLDDESDGPEDKSNASVILEQSKLPASRAKTARRDFQNIPGLYSNQSLSRTVSAPIGRKSISFPAFKGPGEVLVTPSLARSSRTEAAPVQVVTIHSDQFVESQKDMPTKSGKKRKRGQSFNALPDSQQIFKGLSFFFFPNNDVAPARAFRIRKAMEWGAVWIKNWKDGITHVIIDRGLSSKDLLTFLKVQSLTHSLIVVNEDYPADCIRFRAVVNPRQPQYRVAGDEEHLSAPPPTPPAVASHTSLQLKADKEEIARLLPQTPSRTEGSSVDMPVSSDVRSNANEDVAHVPDSMPSSMEFPRDALSEAIEEAQADKGLAIDLDEDGSQASFNVSVWPITPTRTGPLPSWEPVPQNGLGDASKDVCPDNTDSNHSDEEQNVRPKPKKLVSKTWQQGFTCMTKHDGTSKSENPNIRTIEVLQQMADYYDRTQDQWRTIAYRKAISALKKQTEKITTAEQAFTIPSIGHRLADKIGEIVWTDRLRRLDNTKVEPNDEILQTFLKIYGVGLVQATKWIEQGHRTINDLLGKVELTKYQRIGIDHLDDFQSRITRKEMNQHDDYVRTTVYGIDPSIQLTMGGSYRRGASDCGDIDFIVTKPDCPIEVLRTIMLDIAVPQFFKEGYLKVGLATKNQNDGTKWHGAAALLGNTIWRRIDFLLVPWEELGAALIYFTGNDIFNRSIRLLASKKGLRLNQRGLWKDVIRGKRRERLTQGSLVEGKDEKKIFELLGVPWRPPEHRIC